ncbi:unnamed protein product [Paramecium sonneborni]|uniref:Tetratricopeptide repeat protein n=1 Tax=Paramecium sonneborni TaxID=65129 RepID=A0A8S1QX36_9CILI|nr:unnamed protein product [Paramecium sonneborni]
MIKLYLQNHLAFFGKGDCLRILKYYEDALINLEQVLEIKHDHCFSLTSQGVCLLLMKLFQEAIICFQAAFKIDPNYDLPKQKLSIFIQL